MAPRPPRIVAIANQKGGVGKTTTAINLGAALARNGYDVLIVDLDPQGNASTGLGVASADREMTTYDVLFAGVPPQEALRPTAIERLSIIPATTDLSSADLELGAIERRSFLLRDALCTPIKGAAHFDFVLIDCPPSLSLLTVNALVAADAVLVPLQCEFFALEGLSQLMLTIRNVRQSANPDLRLDGVVLTMHDVRNNLSKLVEQDARATLGDLVLETVVPRNVRLSEAPSFALPVIDYDPTSRGAEAYLSLAREIMARVNPRKKETA